MSQPCLPACLETQVTRLECYSCPRTESLAGYRVWMGIPDARFHGDGSSPPSPDRYEPSHHDG